MHMVYTYLFTPVLLKWGELAVEQNVEYSTEWLAAELRTLTWQERGFDVSSLVMAPPRRPLSALFITITKLAGGLKYNFWSYVPYSLHGN